MGPHKIYGKDAVNTQPYDLRLVKIEYAYHEKYKENIFEQAPIQIKEVPIKPVFSKITIGNHVKEKAYYEHVLNMIDFSFFKQ